MPLRVMYELTWPEGSTHYDAISEVRVFALPSGTWETTTAMGDMLALRSASDLIAKAINADLAPEPEDA